VIILSTLVLPTLAFSSLAGATYSVADTPPPAQWNYPQSVASAEVAVFGGVAPLQFETHEQGEDGETEHVGARGAADQTQFQGNNIATPFQVTADNMAIWLYPNRFVVQPPAANGSGFPSALSWMSPVGDPYRKHRTRDLLEGDDEHAVRQLDDQPKTLYISANTCRQPIWTGPGSQKVGPPQLTLYVANSPNYQSLGPNADPAGQKAYPFREGFVNATVPSATGDWYFAVSAPALSSNFTGDWNYEIAASLNAFFHGADPYDPFLFLVDTDVDSALLVTGNLTQADKKSVVYKEWMDMLPPFKLFAVNANLTGPLQGLQNSFCGMQNVIQAEHQIESFQNNLDGSLTHVEMGMITRGLGEKPKQQFYVRNLNSSSVYFVYLAIAGNSTASGNGVVGGGGFVFAPIPFQTKSGSNCQLLFNLTFCDQVAYAAPSNPNIMPTIQDLRTFYDNYTSTWYQNFAYSLAQIPCNTTSAAQYSLAHNCDSCARAYKQWLCAVSIPRCEDFTNPAEFLQIRNVAQPFYNNHTMLDAEFLLSSYVPMSRAPRIHGSNAYEQTLNWSFATNRSRNQAIDTTIMPGPYKEVLPCEDLCYSLTQACPAAFGFVCPYPGRGLEAGYGKRNGTGLTCSYLGAVYYRGAAVDRTVGMLAPLIVPAVVALALVVL